MWDCERTKHVSRPALELLRPLHKKLNRTQFADVSDANSYRISFIPLLNSMFKEFPTRNIRRIYGVLKLNTLDM